MYVCYYFGTILFGRQHSFCASVTEIKPEHISDIIWPITVGCKASLQYTNGLELGIDSQRGKLEVPVSCPQHRFRKPA